MRVCTLFNRILNLPGASVGSVEFTDEGLILELRRPRNRIPRATQPDLGSAVRHSQSGETSDHCAGRHRRRIRRGIQRLRKV